MNEGGSILSERIFGQIEEIETAMAHSQKDWQKVTAQVVF